MTEKGKNCSSILLRDFIGQKHHKLEKPMAMKSSNNYADNQAGKRISYDRPFKQRIKEQLMADQ